MTEDGYYYTISNGEATLTGYDGTLSGFVSMPDEVGDDIPITAIGEQAFANQSQIETILMPIHLTRIEDAAFFGCSSLTRISFYSSPTAEYETFLGCDRLRCLLFESGDEPLGRWMLPTADCEIFYKGSDLGLGMEETLKSASVDEDGVIYGETTNGLSVLLDVPGDMTSLEAADGTSWVAPNAFDRITGELTVYMCDEMTFPYELWNAVNWNLRSDSATAQGRAYSWLLSCVLSDQINTQRDESGIEERVEPAQVLVEVSMERAQELAGSGELSWTRPDGTSWESIVSNYSYNYVGTWQDTFNVDEENVTDVLQEAANEYAPNSGDGLYTQCGAAVARGSDGNYYLAAFLFVP